MFYPLEQFNRKMDHENASIVGHGQTVQATKIFWAGSFGSILSFYRLPDHHFVVLAFLWPDRFPVLVDSWVDVLRTNLRS